MLLKNVFGNTLLCLKLWSVPFLYFESLNGMREGSFEYLVLSNFCRISQTQIWILWVMTNTWSIAVCLCSENIIELHLPLSLPALYVAVALLIPCVFTANTYFFCAFLGVWINLRSLNHRFNHTDLTTIVCQLVSTPGKMKANAVTLFFLTLCFLNLRFVQMPVTFL